MTFVSWKTTPGHIMGQKKKKNGKRNIRKIGFLFKRWFCSLWIISFFYFSVTVAFLQEGGLLFLAPFGFGSFQLNIGGDSS
jgi:hypothetical protein